MQDYFDLWLPRYYPHFSLQKFLALLEDVRRWQLSSHEFQFIVLGCGYLYSVRPVSSEELVSALRQQVTAQHGYIAANALIDARATMKIKTLVKKQGLLVGPQKRQLSETRKSGPLPDPAPRIASLVIAQWIDQQPRRFRPAPWACDLYTSLSRRKLSQATFARYEKIADAEKITIWRGSDKQIPVISHLLDFFQSRYCRLQRDGFPLDKARENPGLLYSIDFLEPVLRAVGVELYEM